MRGSIAMSEKEIAATKADTTDVGVPTEPFQFSVPEHVSFLDGYLDAIGRVLTTESDLWALTARDARELLEGDRVFGAAVRTRTAVENWSREFGSLVDDFLGMNQRTRLGFYLVEYVCWFEEFTRNAECFKVECEPLQPGTIGQVVYLLQLEGNQRVLLLVQHLDKTHDQPLQPLGREDAPSG